MCVRNVVIGVSLSLLAGCVGARSEARPSNPAGYPLVDLPAAGLINQNIQVIGALGSVSPNADSCGMVKFGILRDGDTGSLGAGSIVGTIQAARAEQLRKLPPSTLVRVRGYLSDYEGEGCSEGADDHERFLWVDTIQPTERPATAAR
jgi:hypothetical protein